MTLSPVNKIINEYGMTELHLAAYHQDIDWVKACIRDNFDINQKDRNGWTPLMWAIDMAATSEKGVAKSIIELLILNGANTDIQPSKDESITDFSYRIHPEVGEFISKIINHKN